MEQKKTNLIEAASEFISRHTPLKFKEVEELHEEDDAVTKRVNAKHPDVGHIVSEGPHHIYAAEKDRGIKYVHHNSSTGKTTSLGIHGRNATESNYSDMRSKMEDHGIKISDKTDQRLVDYHDSTI
tara:strand:- start:96 stop:473 length:378 start_codon:yes stop_codon:yes gene_type:complete